MKPTERSLRRSRVTAEGIELAYTAEGAGPPLLVAGSSIFYPRTFSDQLRKSYSLVCMDLPHFAPPAAGVDPDRIGFDLYADCMEAVRIDAGLERVIAIGHSHHGNVALEYARRYPANVDGVVMIGSPPVNIDKTVQGAKQYWERNASKQRRAILEQRRQSLEETIAGASSPTAAFVARYVADAPLYWNDPSYDAGWLWEGMDFSMDCVDAFRRLYTSYAFDPGAGLQHPPLLIVTGKSDFAVPHTLWKPLIESAGPNLSFHLLEHSGHTPQLEQPSEFDRILSRWVDSIDLDR